MKVLAFDTALNGCSAAFVDGGRAVRRTEAMGRGQSEQLLPMIDAVLAEAKAGFKDIDLIAATRGPGAFTGLRIGLSAAKALALALGKPVMGVSTMEALARSFFENHPGADRVCVLIDTKRKDFYAQFFDRAGVDTGEPMVASDKDLWAMGIEKMTAIGDGAPLFQHDGWDVEDGYELPDPVMVARIAVENMLAGAEPGIEPLYLRGAEVSFPKKK
jgi:tRNA threonylcarbamoyladenosine biosynthesis protein TsaB